MLTQEERKSHQAAVEYLRGHFANRNDHYPLHQGFIDNYEKLVESERRLSQALQKAEEGLRSVCEATMDKIAINIAHRTSDEINRIKEGK